MFLDYFDTDLIPVQGTAIEDALNKAIEALDSEDNSSKAIILITDGEDTMGDPIRAAKNRARTITSSAPAIACTATWGSTIWV